MSISDKFCLAKTTNAGAWSFNVIDITKELMPLHFHNTKHLDTNSLIKHHAKKFQVNLTCCAAYPSRPNQIISGDNKGFIHIIDIYKTMKL